MKLLRGDRVALRSATEADIPALETALATPEVARWWGNYDVAADMEDGEDGKFAVVVDDTVAGMVEWYEEDDPEYRHAGIDLFLHPRYHRQGLGVDVVRTLARWLMTEHGHHRVVIDPCVDNVAAIRCFQKVGFRPVGVLRQYWRDPEGVWRDGLLMDLIADDFPDLAPAS